MDFRLYGNVPPPPEEMPFSTGGIWNGSVVGTIDPNPAATAVSPTSAIDLNDEEVVILATEADTRGISQFRSVSERELQAVGEIDPAFNPYGSIITTQPV